MNAEAGLPTGFAVPVLETGKGGGRTGAGLPTGFAVPVLETGSPGPCKTGACSGLTLSRASQSRS